MLGNHVVFIGYGAEEHGVHAKINDLLGVIADNHTFVPYGQFTHFTKSSIDNELVAFYCRINNYSFYIFTNFGGELTKVIGKSDTLDDKTVSHVVMDTEGLGGNKIAFRAYFSDGSAGIFVAEVMTCEGDFDHDGDVDGSDLAVFAADFGRTDCPH